MYPPYWVSSKEGTFQPFLGSFSLFYPLFYDKFLEIRHAVKAEGNGRPIVQQCCCRWRQDTGYTKGNQRGIKGNNKIIVEN